MFITDLQRLLEKPHKIDDRIITVVRQPPPKKVPLDPLRLHVQGISKTTTKDCLSFYLEKFADVDVEEVYLGVKDNALAVFESEPGNFKTKRNQFMILRIDINFMAILFFNSIDERKRKKKEVIRMINQLRLKNLECSDGFRVFLWLSQSFVKIFP